MPKYYRSGWSDAGQAATHLSHSLQGLALDVGRQRFAQDIQRETLIQHTLENQQLNKYRNEQLRLQEQHYAAQNAEAASRAKLHEQQATGLQSANESAEVVGSLLQYIANNPGSEEDLMGDVVGQGSVIAAQHPASIMKSIAQGAVMNNPALRRNMAVGGERNLYNNVPGNSVGVSTVPGVQPIQGPSIVQQGALGFDPRFANLSGEGEIREPTAYGMPPRADDQPSQDLGRLGQILRASMPGGDAPDIKDPTFPIYQMMTNAITRNAVAQGRPQPMAISQTPVNFTYPPPSAGLPPGYLHDESADFQVPQKDYSFPVPQQPEYMSTDERPKSQPKASSAKAKAARANDLERENPTLSRQAIIDMVNAEFGGH